MISLYIEGRPFNLLMEEIVNLDDIYSNRQVIFGYWFIGVGGVLCFNF